MLKRQQASRRNSILNIYCVLSAASPQPVVNFDRVLDPACVPRVYAQARGALSPDRLGAHFWLGALSLPFWGSGRHPQPYDNGHLYLIIPPLEL